MNKRAVILSTFILFGFFLVAVRLADLMLLNHKRLSEKARFQYSEKKDFVALRGGIFDRKGWKLAVNLDVDSLYCNPREIGAPEKTARALSGVTGQPYRSVLKKVSSDRGFMWVERELDFEKAARLKKLNLKGVGFIPETKRFYPLGRLASHVLGFVGIDDQPLEGIEFRYDGILKGRREAMTLSRDARGRTLSEGLETEQAGNGIVLNVDQGLQYIVESALDGAMGLWNASSSMAIMMDPYTGEILAMANRPTYDPNEPGHYASDSRRNRSVTDTYEPGSTFKIVMATGALEERTVAPGDEFDCSGPLKIGSMTVRDEHENGVLDFKRVIQSSSNVGTVLIAQRLGEERLHRYAKRLGFGEYTGVDLPGEARGQVIPTEEWSASTLAAMAIGYEVSVTPLQILRAYSAVANGGFLVRPHLLRGIITPEGQLLRFQVERPVRALSPRTASVLGEILAGVTEQGGTALGASVEGNRVAGKTGTAKLLDGGRYSAKKFASSFVGFVPADGPRVALIVVVREPKGQHLGGLVAGPVFRQIAEQSLAYLNVPREDMTEDVMVSAKGARLDNGGFN